MTTEKQSEKLDFAGFEDGGRSHSPRDVRGRYKLQQARKQIVPWSLQKGVQSCQHLDFSAERPISDFWAPEL